MAAEVLDRLFQPFGQADSSISRRFGGTGLGLHISWTLAELMGGRIDVESEEGKGSTFTLVLPWRPSERRSGEQRTLDSSATASRFRGQVLLVEDSPELQKLESLLLEGVGATVTLAANGQEAVELALGQQFDLILMDMQMPVMNGIEATATLRALHYRAPIIALTANIMPQHQQEFQQAGCNDFLGKPINQRGLRQLLQRYLEVVDADTTPEQEVAVDPEISARARPIFLQRLPLMEQALRQALATKEWSSVRHTTHDLKGSAALFGFATLAQQAGEICDAIESGEGASTESRVERLIESIEAAVSSD